MDYSPWGHKDSDMTKQLSLSLLTGGTVNLGLHFTHPSSGRLQLASFPSPKAQSLIQRWAYDLRGPIHSLTSGTKMDLKKERICPSKNGDIKASSPHSLLRCRLI